MRTMTAGVLLVVLTLSVSASDTYEAMYRKLHKKITAEFVDTKLTDCLELVAQITGVNIVVHPRIRADNPTVNLKINDMDAATLIKWLTELTNTHADVKDQAVFVSDQEDKSNVEADKNALAIRMALANVQFDMPPPGQALSEQDIMRAALALWQKEDVKPQDFPGPDLSLDPASTAIANPFQIGN
jgi:hypothetical protein